MTTTKSTYHDVVVVDGSNIATEGRSMPSLAQLNEAVIAFREEFPEATITVVVDATFGHRIDKSEVKQFDEAVAHNEVVAPPAGAIGRGDAFVLTIANKVGARILSNDSFQEFHGDYTWLFDEGRLIGGKPVPYVGWVFVERLPVKGPASRKSTRAARSPREAQSSRRTVSKEASLPMPVPSAPPPNARTSRGGARRSGSEVATTVVSPTPEAPAMPAPSSGAPVNEVMTFLDFVEHHPVGSSVNGVVESYSSHGAYVQIGELRGYVPLRLMSDPPPRSAREVMKVGDAVTLVVTSFAAARRSVDLAVPAAVLPGEIQPAPELAVIAVAVQTATAEVSAAKPSRRGRKAAVAAIAAATEEAVAEIAAAVSAPEESAPVTKAPGRTAAAKKAPAAKASTKKAAAKKAPAKTAPAKKAAAKKAAATSEPAVPVASVPVKKAAARRSATKPVADAPTGSEPAAAPVKKALTTSTAAKKAPVKKAPAKRASRKAADDEAPVSTQARRRRGGAKEPADR